jgi:hypothetical protein
MTFVLALLALLVMLALLAQCQFHNEGAFERHITVFRNGGNNSACEHVSVRLRINTVTDDFAFFKARAGLKLTYIPQDCTPWSRTRLRRPASELCPPLFEDAEPAAQCAYTTYTDRLRVFTREGVLLRDLYFVKDGDALFVVPPGDHFFWPGEFVGRKIVVPGVKLPDGSPVTLETLSLRPPIYFIERFVTDDESSKIIAAASPLLHESRAFEKGSSVKIEARNSEQAWLSCFEKPGEEVANHSFVCDIDQRIADVTRIPLVHVQQHSDALQVVHYSPEQHYHSHHDFFDATLHPTTPGLREGYNRMITFLWYLNDVEAGGETIFPLTGDNKYERESDVDMSSCARGLKVKPRKGAALLWYNLHALGNSHEGRVDRASLHGGCDVSVGEKWASNKWIYNRKWSARDLVDTELEGSSGTRVPMPPPPLYPSSDDAATGERARRAGEVTVRFKNALAAPVELFWNGQAELVPMGEMSAKGARVFTSYAGHAWTAKSGGVVVGEFKVAAAGDTVDFLVGAADLKTEL